MAWCVPKWFAKIVDRIWDMYLMMDQRRPENAIASIRSRLISKKKHRYARKNTLRSN